MIKRCEFCNKEFEAERISKKYCSKKCSDLAYYYRNKDKILKRVKEYRLKHLDKIREKSKERFKKWYEKNKAKQSNWAKKYNKENSELLREKRYFRGFAYKYLREKLLKKFNYRCSMCGAKKTDNKIDRNLQIHHKKYTKNINDCIVLCKDCHRKIHRKY